MKVQTTTQQNLFVVQLSGELDANSVNQFEPYSQQVLSESCSAVAIDLSGVDFIDSSGIGLIVFLVKRLWAQHRKVCLAGLQGQPQRLVTMLRIPQSINCYASVDEFLVQCQQGGAAVVSGRG